MCTNLLLQESSQIGSMVLYNYTELNLHNIFFPPAYALLWQHKFSCITSKTLKFLNICICIIYKWRIREYIFNFFHTFSFELFHMKTITFLLIMFSVYLNFYPDIIFFMNFNREELANARRLKQIMGLFKGDR